MAGTRPVGDDPPRCWPAPQTRRCPLRSQTSTFHYRAWGKTSTGAELVAAGRATTPRTAHDHDHHILEGGRGS